MSATRCTAVFLLPLGIALTLCLGSCSKNEARVAAVVQVSDGPFPRTVRLSGGREFQIAAPPQRVLPTNASVVDFLFDLLPPERVVALPREAFTYSVVSSEFASSDEADRWTKLPVLNEFAAEDTLSVKPDLVIAHAWQRGTTLTILREAGIPVLELPVVTDWQGVLETLEVLGRALGEDERCRELIADLETRRKALARRGSGLAILPYTNWGTGGYTAGAGSTWDLMIELAGARNAAAEYGLEGNVQIEYEELLEIDPDVFLLGIDPESGMSRSSELLRTEPALASLEAVRSSRLVVMPAALYNASSHRMLPAAEMLALELEKLRGPSLEAPAEGH